MGEAMRRVSFLLPAKLLEDVSRAVPRGQLNIVVREALRNELQRVKFRRAIHDSFGAWKASAHPELTKGTRRFVRCLRRSSRRTQPGA